MANRFVTAASASLRVPHLAHFSGSGAIAAAVAAGGAPTVATRLPTSAAIIVS